MLRSANATIIGRLKIRGSKDHCQRLQQEFSLMEWPEPDDAAWVFVRKLHVQAPAHRAAADVKSQAKNFVAQNTESENIKRFQSDEAMVSAFACDLLDGNASERWYWQHWSHLFTSNTSSALRQLLSEFISHTSAVLQRLYDARKLEKFWQCLTEEDALRLKAEMASQGGYRNIDISEIAANIPAYDLAMPTAIHPAWYVSLASLAGKSQKLQWAQMMFARQHWPLAFAQAPAETLKTVILWWQMEQTLSPLHSDHARSPKHDQEAAENYSHSSDDDRKKTQKGRNSSGYDARHSSSIDRSTLASSEKSVSISASSDLDIPAISSGDLHNRSTRNDESTTETSHNGSIPFYSEKQIANSLHADQAENTVPHLHSSSGSNSSDHADKKIGVHSTDSASAPWTLSQNDLNARAMDERSLDMSTDVASANLINSGDESFTTQQGGMLFLLNVLRRQEMQQLLADYWTIYPSGWFWLYRLAELLHVDEDDPLAQFVLQQMGVDANTPLSSVPPLPQAEQIRSLLGQWYAPETLWNKSLLALPARIQTSQSHIDLFAPINSVRLDVRLAGLDVNPGWLPWLGRVVHFHFQEAQY
ncbi:hypothetical protein TDB9533_03156 [Thalassocella blandensis]|nr:hypothetical protein TDB9533_03156 [Thalassocella blandensis]